ncbi:MAG: hypothetical protein RMK29_08525 [Myxococcales bacterium]|nr:hypothetical protein [Myxococcota bacterium]MDW8281740.1 hypothetical protein [Myxococcales bacterium]
MMLRGLVCTAVALWLSGCLIIDTPPPGPSPLLPGSGRDKPINFPLSRILPGAAAPDPGYDGVIITANIGGSYRITWDTTWQGFNRIQGSVFTQSGANPQFFPGCTDRSCALTSRDQVVVGNMPGRIDFLGLPGSPVRSGFDIVIGDTDVLILDVLTNGVPDPGRVVFVSTDTRALASAPGMPFGLTTR